MALKLVTWPPYVFPNALGTTEKKMKEERGEGRGNSSDSPRQINETSDQRRLSSPLPPILRWKEKEEEEAETLVTNSHAE